MGSLLSKLAGPLMKIGFSLENFFLVSLGITATVLALDAGIQNEEFQMKK